MSQRPFQLPAVRMSHEGVCHAIPTPSRWAISVAVSMSKPSYLPVFALSDDCGGYAGSVETLIVPRLHTSASRPPAALAPWQAAPLAVPLGDAAADPLSSSPPHAATESASTTSTDKAAEDRRMTFLLLRRP